MTSKPTLVTAPINVGDPNAAASLAIDQSHIEEFANAEEGSHLVRCRKPPKGIFFTVQPEATAKWQNCAFYFLLEIEGHDPYIVHPAVADQKKEEDVIRPILLVRYVTMAGEEGLWPLKLDLTDARSNPYNKSALAALEVASSGSWVRLVSAKGHYRHQKSKKTLEETPPRFSNWTFNELFDSAFKDRIVSSLEHEIWELLDQGSEK